MVLDNDLLVWNVKMVLDNDLLVWNVKMVLDNELLQEPGLGVVKH